MVLHRGGWLKKTFFQEEFLSEIYQLQYQQRGKLGFFLRRGVQ